jgi:outer membrane protein TolC
LILDREGKLLSAKQQFAEATIALSLFVRNERGESQLVLIDRAPQVLLAPRPEFTSSLQSDLNRALATRPELCELQTERNAQAAQLRLAGNQRAPDIRAGAFVARDVGTGPSELAPAELGVGVTLEMPLGLTKARGNYDAARAEAAELRANYAFLEDKIRASVRGARVAMEMTAAQLLVAREQLAIARTLAEAERYKFDSGASDLVVVNLRELAANDAQRQAVEAEVRHHQALADYAAATGETARLNAR